MHEVSNRQKKIATEENVFLRFNIVNDQFLLKEMNAMVSIFRITTVFFYL